jgi:DNA repair protein RecN (Recombination protein N)
VLAEMRIQGLGVIADATLELHPGLTVVTGETGAGKTMVVTGLHLLSGGRAESSRVRTGAGKAVVEGRFEPAAQSLAARLAADAGAELDDDGSLIAVRTVNADRGSRAHLGGRSVPISVLSDLSDALLAVHGQNDQLRLLRSNEQRAVLDRFAGDAVAGPLTEYRRVRAEWLRVSTELVERRERARELAREADLLRHGLTEITAVAPQPAEDDELVAEARRLADADQLRTTAAAAQGAVAGVIEREAPGALDLVGEARRWLESAEDPALRELAPRLGEVAALLADVGAELSGYLESLQADPQRLEAVLRRQAELKQLTRKYAADVNGVLAWAEQAQQRMAGLDTSEEAMVALSTRRDELAVELAGLAASITSARQAAAKALADAVTAELAGLAMPHARLEVAVLPRTIDAGAPAASDGVAARTVTSAVVDGASARVGTSAVDGASARVLASAVVDGASARVSTSALVIEGQAVQAGPDGVDEVELRLVPHPGAPALPVHKGASGGELSRVMLALEVVLADSDPVPTLVFDEVDAGVGGRAAVEVGRRLARLARSHQVIVVTHLPQVAAYADRHLVVDKVNAESGLTRSGVRVVDDKRRVIELARMLAGLEDTETGRAHAEELLATARTHRAADEAGH